MSRAVEWSLYAVALTLFTNAALVLYKPVAQYRMAVPVVRRPSTGSNDFRCMETNTTRVVKEQVDYTAIATAIPRLDPRYRTTSLTRLGTDLNFDGSTCPTNSLRSKHLLTNETPLHLDCPTLFLVGARKSGTTSLYQYLSKHPDFEGARLDKGPAAGELFHFSSRYGKESWDVYLSRFPSDRVMTGDASVGNFVRCEVPQRLFESCGRQAKIVILLRNPIDRFVSNFLMRARAGTRKLHETSSLRTSLKVEVERFVSETLRRNIDVTRMSEEWTSLLCMFGPSSNLIFEGLYYVHLSNWLCNFPVENILVLNSEEFYRDTTLILSQVMEFLGLSPLDDETLKWITSNAYNRGNYTVPFYQKPTDRDRKLLRGVYDPFNNALMKLLNWDYSKVRWL